MGLVSILGILLGDRNILLGKNYDQPYISYQTKVEKIDTKHMFVFYEAPSIQSTPFIWRVISRKSLNAFHICVPVSHL